jgi:hypothetical protein
MRKNAKVIAWLSVVGAAVAGWGGEARAQIDPPGKPRWTECRTTPGWWDSLWTCRVCSPGYYTDTYCFGFSDGERACCGVTLNLGTGEEVTVVGGVEHCGVSVGVTVTNVKYKEVAVTAKDCECCSLEVCFPGGQVRVWECSRRVPKKWGWRWVHDGLARCREYTVIEWGTETYYESEFIPGGPAVYAPKCADASAFCTAQGRDCDDKKHHAEESVEVFTEAAPQVAVWSISVESVRDRVFQGEIGGLEDLSLLQLRILRHLAEKGTGALPVTEDGARASLIFADGTTFAAEPGDFLATLEKYQNDLVNSSGFYDINRDGFFEVHDAFALYDYVVTGENGAEWPTWADLNADSLVSDSDLEQLVAHL